MIRIFTLALLTAALTGCGSGVNSMDTPVVAPEFEQYVEYFEHAASERGVAVRRVSIQFGATGSDAISAMCHRGLTHGRSIDVSPQWWEASKNNDSLRRLIIAHELGHCVLDRAHDDEVLPDGRPASMMNAHPNSGAFALDVDAYLNELFGMHPTPAEL